MDGSNFVTQAMRYDHLQRLLKQYELEALNSLRGPATLSGAADLVSGSSSASSSSSSVQLQIQPQSVAPSDAEKTSLSSLFNAASALCRQNKPIENSAPPSRNTRRVEESDAGRNGERPLNSDRSVLHQETLLREILTLRSAIPVQPLPVLTPQDRTSGAAERKDTLLEGEVITCFVVGGEKRLCLPQVLNTVLKNVSMVDINRACTELNIHCGHCTPEQLLVLKIASVVSATTASCALITKTDAERLCDYLLRQKRHEYRAVPSQAMLASLKGERMVPFTTQHQLSSNAKPTSETTRKTSMMAAGQHVADERGMTNTKAERDISVIHYCFGRCRGLYLPSLYASPSAECIQCDECGLLFAPDRFVVHSHGNQERRTCHWGFDSANWRAYLHLTDEDECEENSKILDEMKVRFDVTGLSKKRQDAVVDAGGDAKRMAEFENAQGSKKRARLELSDQSTVPKDAPEKATATLGTTGSVLPGLDPASLPYLLCDPILLAAYYQAALAAATATIRAAVPQTASNTPMVPPSSLPQLMTGSVLQAPQKQQQATFAGASQSLDGFDLKTGILPLQPRQRETQPVMRDRPFLDEATAAAALKLLQLHAGGTEDFCMGKLHGSTQPLNSQEIGQVNSSNCNGDEAMRICSTSMKPLSQQHSASFKKQLLHMFAAEQQEKEEQRRQEDQRKELPSDADLKQRGSVEIIVDDGGQEPNGQWPLSAQRLQAATSSSESEKVDGHVGTPDTQVADELSVSSSDNEGGNGDLSLDELLRRYIADPDGLKLVRAKIAENQRYLEQKLDAVSAENRLLHAECVQLRTKQLQHRQQQESSAMAASFLGKAGIGSLMGFLPKQLL